MTCLELDYLESNVTLLFERLMLNVPLILTNFYLKTWTEIGTLSKILCSNLFYLDFPCMLTFTLFLILGSIEGKTNLAFYIASVGVEMRLQTF